MNLARMNRGELVAEAERRGLQFSDKSTRDDLITLLRAVLDKGEEELDGMSIEEIIAQGNEIGVEWPCDPMYIGVDGLLEIVQNHADAKANAAATSGNAELAEKLDRLTDAILADRGIKRGVDVADGYVNPDTLANGRKIRILIPATPEEGGDRPVTVGFNGKQWQIPRDTPCEVPYPLIEILNNAQTETLHQDGKPDLQTGVTRYIRRRSQRFQLMVGDGVDIFLGGRANSAAKEDIYYSSPVR